jgi:hypothetical protein
MLAEVHCTGGQPNFGGICGQGGNGGKPGKGGPSLYHVNFMGWDGDPGRNGAFGNNGAKGEAGANGKMLWVVLSPEDHHVIEESCNRYEPRVESIKVTPALIGGVFEPNSTITVSDVTVNNTGGLTIPSGTKVSVPSTSSVKFEPTFYEFADNTLKPHESHVIPSDFHGRLCDFPPPNTPGPQSAKAEFETRIELLGRPFHLCFMKHELTVHYPVQLGHLSCPESLTWGEVGVFTIEIRNISSLSYGSCGSSCGGVVLQLHLDSRLRPLGPPTTHTAIPYLVTYDPNLSDSLFVEVSEVLPNQTTRIQIMVQMAREAELFDVCRWQADLYFREKLIEYNQQHIRISPYLPQSLPADVLFVTSEAISRKEFKFWNRVFSLLDVSVDFWDVTKNQGLSVNATTGTRHANSWQDRYAGKAILYPHCDLAMINGSDITQHFTSDHGIQSLMSSMVLFVPRAMSEEEHSELMLKKLVERSNKIHMPGVVYGGYHPTKPVLYNRDSNSPDIKWEEMSLTKLKRDDPSRLPVVFKRQINIRPIGLFRYSYGSVDIRRYPIPRSSKFLSLSDSVTEMGADDANLTLHSTDIPLASNFGQVFLATLLSLSISSKLKLLKSDSSLIHGGVSFHLPNRIRLSCEEIVAVTLAWDIADELYSCSGKSLRMGEIHADITADPVAYKKNGRLLLRGLKFAKKKANACAEKLNCAKVSSAYSDIVKLSNDVDATLAEMGVDNSDLERLVGLNVLLLTYPYSYKN